MLEQKPNSEQKVETLDSSSPNSINTHVVGSQSHGTLIESVVKVDVSDDLVCLLYSIGGVQQNPMFLSHSNLINACLSSIRQAVFQTFQGNQSGSHTPCKTFQ
jgi:hypothetical protein